MEDKFFSVSELARKTELCSRAQFTQFIDSDHCEYRKLMQAPILFSQSYSIIRLKSHFCALLADAR